jgi:hypothetical protein
MTTKSRAKRDKKKQAEATIGDSPLAEEVTTYDSHLPGWADREGQFVLIKGRDVLGFYTRDEDALEAGYSRLGSGPFLVKQILFLEPIYELGRVEL